MYCTQLNYVWIIVDHFVLFIASYPPPKLPLARIPSATRYFLISQCVSKHQHQMWFRFKIVLLCKSENTWFWSKNYFHIRGPLSFNSLLKHATNIPYKRQNSFECDQDLLFSCVCAEFTQHPWYFLSCQRTSNIAPSHIYHSYYQPGKSGKTWKNKVVRESHGTFLFLQKVRESREHFF